MVPPEPYSDYVELDHLVSEGDISQASKAQLERYAVMLSRPSAHTQLGHPRLTELGDTVRTLLIVRMSEEVNKEATRISKTALWIAGAALVVAVVQAVVVLRA
jgi:hypothetical protein